MQSAGAWFVPSVSRVRSAEAFAEHGDPQPRRFGVTLRLGQGKAGAGQLNRTVARDHRHRSHHPGHGPHRDGHRAAKLARARRLIRDAAGTDGDGVRKSRPGQGAAEETVEEKLAPELSAIHARWLMTCREDLEGQSPRDVLLAKLEFIDFDLHTRQLQWTELGEGPPCLATDSFAYRFAGFGTDECVLYYDLVRHLLWRALDFEDANKPAELEKETAALERARTEWLENPQEDCGGRIPAILIENERRRLPIALRAQDMIVDDDCELCVMSANHVAMGYGPGFWHLDGSNMDDDFAFSFYRTQAEWDEENRRREEFNREFNRRWEEREQRLARGEPVDDEFDLDWVDSLNSKSTDRAPADAEASGETVQ